MGDGSGPGAGNRTTTRRWRRRLVLLLAAALALEILYLVAGNLVIDSAWLRDKINRRPARVTVTWTDGWTLFPGRVHLDHVRVVGQSHKFQYAVAFDSGRFLINPWNLFNRKVQVLSGHATSLDVRVRRRLDTNDIPEDKAEHYPPMDGLNNPPTEKPEALYPQRDLRPPWTIHVDGLEVEDLRQVWVNGIRLQGSGRLISDFNMVVRGDLGISQARLVTSEGRLSMGQNILAEHLSMTADVRLGPYSYQQVKGKEILQHLSADILLQGDLKSLAFVDDHGGEQAGVRFGGTGSIDADLQISKGRFQPGSNYTVDAQNLEIKFLDYVFASSGTVKGRAWTEDEQELGGTEVTLGRLTGHRLHHEDQTLSAPSLSFSSVVKDPALAAEEPLRQIAIDLPGVSIPRIALFNDLLPEVLGMEFRNGSALLSAGYTIDAHGGASGTLSLQGTDLVAWAQQGEFSGDLLLDASYRTDDFRAPTYDLGGTHLAISRVFMTDTQRDRKKKNDTGWWFDVQLTEALIDITSETKVGAKAAFSMRDIKPLVILLKEEGKAPRWFGMMPNVKDVKGYVALDLIPDEFDLHQLDITGKGLKLMGRLETDRGGKRGAFYAKYKGLAVGIALDDSSEKKKKRWTLVKPLRWYQAKLAELDAAMGGLADLELDTPIVPLTPPAP